MNSETRNDLLWTSRSRRSAPHPAAMVTGVAALVVAGMFGWILTDILYHGLTQLSWAFLTSEPQDAGRQGGISTILLSTLMILAITLVIVVPVSLSTAVGLAERRSRSVRFDRITRRSLDVLAACPSIVFGLFGNAFFCIYLGMGYSILAGGLTLACMVLPLLIRTSEQAIRAVPDDYRYAAASLGMSRWTTLFRVVLPAALPAMAAGLVLSIGRALSETAALIFTSGYVTRSPESLFDSGRAMSVHIYDLAMNVPGGNPRAYATAATLLIVLFVINGIAVRLTCFAGAMQNPSLEENH
ncbi:phosphate ABC transporter permease PstA [Rubinisphaera margarita]|uniref:phosphate ABC transporter permease PstA n=1 Tax=Rubinisphaera margarita TaxID=2909586 RepID=UPI001EE89A71|nr:phosphate ABC transporter permease PstA [Rubinisphaera margarita]MCG6158120.1 phosphate ABC transporter permease PstA [Rubinisphaera margarita]